MQPTDVERIAQSVFRDYGLSYDLSISADPKDSSALLLTLSGVSSPHPVRVKLFCGPGASPVSIRESLKRQLDVEA